MTSPAERRAGIELRNERTTLEMFVRFTDGTGRTMHAVENTIANRRIIERMAAHLMAKDNVDSIDVDVRTGRTAGYERSGR